MNEKNKEDFLIAYIEAIDFTLDTEDRGAQFADETAQCCAKDCEAFLALAGDLIAADDPNAPCDKWAYAGHDFWLTRNHHGAGFWDGDWNNGDALTDITHKFQTLEPYTGDDGLLYF